MPTGLATGPSASPDREDALERAVAAPLDVLVVGGGITGAGIALDAVTRGYRVALVERHDLASGTSSKSSKLVHGGLRYLATGDVRMVAEGVRERDRLRRLAPHLVRPLGFVVPTDGPVERARLALGLGLYDGIALGRNVRGHRRLDAAGMRTAAPGLTAQLSRGGYRYYDCQTDDARLTLQVAQTARHHGALVVNHTPVVELCQADGRVVGARVRDGLTGAEHTLHARWTVSASGVWADRLRGMAPGSAPPELTPAKGVHLCFPRELVEIEQAVVIPSGAGDGRHNFVIPWGGQVYVGTTDEAWDGDPDRPHIERDEAEYLLSSINAAFGTLLTVREAIGAWAGLRPLLTSVAAASKDLSRSHAVAEGPDGLLTVTGGKLTTYRQMAEDAVDHLARADGHRGRSVTRRQALGATVPPEDGLARTGQAVRRLGLDPGVAGAVYHRHGDRAQALLAFCAEHGETDPLVPGLPYLCGEVRWAVREELARTVDDVLQRRTRVALRHRDAGGPAVERVAGILADELGWSPTERERQVEDYLAGVRHERGPVPLGTSGAHGDARPGA